MNRIALVTLLAFARSQRGRGLLASSVVLAALVVPASAASAGEAPGPSCNGVFSSAAAGDPGHVAEVAHFVKDLSELLGVSPGAFNSEGARTHCQR